MTNEQQPLEDIQHIRKMMERSSRFISLSGLSGVSAGICALIGAWFAESRMKYYLSASRTKDELTDFAAILDFRSLRLINELLWIATLTFIGAFISAFIFTYLKSKKNGTSLWGSATSRLFWNTVIPVAVGGIFLLRMLELGQVELIAPGCLIFYGLALVNGSKYTLGEIRYLGYGDILLGIFNLWYVGYGLYFWAMGFGILHILYGIVMWYKYEKK